MRPFSRWMPPAPEVRNTVAGWLCLAGLVAGIIAATVAWPVFMGFLFAFVAATQLVAAIASNRHLRRLAAERAGEDIGTFARAFDRRTESFDPWVLRATWEALRPWVTFREGCLPLRP